MSKSVLGSIFKRFTNLTIAFVLTLSSASLALPLLLSGTVSAATSVSSQQELVDAIAGSDTEIVLAASFTTTSQININRPLILQGAGYTISPSFSGTPSNDSALAIVSTSEVTVNNLIINGTNATAVQGIQIWQASALLNNIVSTDNDKAGVHVNNSTVTINGITTARNGTSFAGVVISSGLLTINGQSRHTSEPISQIRRNGGTIIDTNGQYNNAFSIIYSLKSAPVAPLITAPAQNAVSTARSTTIIWNAAAYASTYNIDIDGSIESSISGTSLNKILSYGTHTVKIQSVAKSGLTGAWSTPKIFTIIDTVAPTTPIAQNPNGWQGAQNTTFSWSASIDDSSVTYELITAVHPNKDANGKLENGVVPRVTNHASPTWSTVLTDGSYFWQVRATDAAGNVSPWSNIGSLTIDSTSPVITSSLTDNQYLKGTVTIDQFVEEKYSKVFHFYLHNADGSVAQIDGTNVGAYKQDPTTNTLSLNNLDTKKLTDGKYFFLFTAKDVIGNSATPLKVWVVVDNTAPKASNVSVMPSPAKRIDQQVSLQLKISDTTSTIRDAKYTLYNDDTDEVIAKNIPINGDFSSNEILLATAVDIRTLPIGTYRIQLHFNDAAGNQGKSTTKFSINNIDTSTTIVISPIDTSTNTPIISGTLQWNADDSFAANQLIHVKVDGTTYQTTTDNNGKWGVQFNELRDNRDPYIADVHAGVLSSPSSTKSIQFRIGTFSDNSGNGNNNGGEQTGTNTQQPSEVTPAPAFNLSTTIAARFAVPVVAVNTTPTTSSGVLEAQTFAQNTSTDTDTAANENNSDNEAAKGCGKFLGLCWYWWVAIVVGLGVVFYIYRASNVSTRSGK